MAAQVASFDPIVGLQGFRRPTRVNSGFRHLLGGDDEELETLPPYEPSPAYNEENFRVTSDVKSSAGPENVQRSDRDLRVGEEDLEETCSKLLQILKPFTIFTSQTRKPLEKQMSDIPEAARGTCQWILRHEKYLSWLSQSAPNVLVVLAGPGHGKSVLSKSLLRLFEPTGRNVTAFFCRSESSDRNSIQKIVASFLYEAVRKNHRLARYTPKSMFDTGISFPALFDLFVDISNDVTLKDCVCIIDALDECTAASQKQLFEAMEKRKDDIGAKIFITARPDPALNQLANLFPTIRVSSKDIVQDVCLFLKSELDGRRFEKAVPQNVEELLGSDDIDDIDGLFLRTTLRLYEFDEARKAKDFDTSHDNIRNFFRGVPDAFNNYYERALIRAKASAETADCTTDMLSILLAAQEGLTEAQLNIAYQMNRRIFRSHDALTNATLPGTSLDIQHVCGPFVKSVDGKFELRHQSAREFLQNVLENTIVTVSGLRAKSNAEFRHSVLAAACLRYLLLPEVKITDSISFQVYPFMTYSLQHWAHHVRESGDGILLYKDSLSHFLDPKGKAYREWVWFHEWIGNDLRVPDKVYVIPVISCLAIHGLSNVVRKITTDEANGKHALFDVDIDLNEASPSGKRPLVLAILNEEVLVLRALLAAGSDPNFEDGSGGRPLHLAVALKNESMVEALLAHGADVNAESMDVGNALFIAVDEHLTPVMKMLLQSDIKSLVRSSDGWTLAHEAATCGSLELIEYIAEHFADFDLHQADNDEWTPLHVAVGAGASRGCTVYLLEHGADINAANSNGMTPLHEAASHGNKDLVELLLECGALIEATARHWTPLMCATRNGHTDVVRLLLERGADADAVDDNNSTALILAFEEGNLDSARILLEFKADVNIADCLGTTPLMKLCRRGWTEFVSQVLEQGAEILPAADDDMTALHLAAYNGHEEIVRILVDAISDSKEEILNALHTDTGWTPLLAALREKQTAVSRILLRAGSDVSISSTTGWTALHMACRYCDDADLCRELLEAGAGVNDETVDGLWPLHLAAEAGHVPTMEVILSTGQVDPSRRSKSSFTPLYLATLSGKGEAVELMLQYDLDPEVRSERGYTALHGAAQHCDSSIVVQLLNLTNWVSHDPKTLTPLQCAALGGKPENIRVLLREGMDLHVAPEDGSTALHTACLEGQTECAEVLLDAGADKDALSDQNNPPVGLTWAREEFKKLPMKRLYPDVRRVRKFKSDLGNLFIEAAAAGDVDTLRTFIEQGFNVNTTDCIGETALSQASFYGRSEAVEFLLKQPQLEVDSAMNVTGFAGMTALAQAARGRHSECVTLLLKAGANPLSRDFFGLTPIEYVLGHDRLRSLMLEHSVVSIRGREAERLNDSERRQEELIRQITRLLRYQADICDVPQADPVETIRRVGYYALAFPFLRVGDVDNACTAAELRLSPPGTVFQECCRFCRTRAKNEPLNMCKTCPDVQICDSCKEKTEEEPLFGCYKHSFVAHPRKSWFSRDKKAVNDEGQTEAEWLQETITRYKLSSDSSLKLPPLAKLETGYDPGRPSIRDFCLQGDVAYLQEHLEEYPRDVWSRDAQGYSPVLCVASSDLEDEQKLQLLNVLAAAGANLLDSVKDGPSTIELTVAKQNEHSSLFILDNWDPNFNRTNEHGPRMLTRILELQWTSCVHVVIRKHFTWVAKDEFDWLQELSGTGLTVDAMAEVLLRLNFGSPWIRSEQLPCHRKPKSGEKAHARDCVHSAMARNDNIPSSQTYRLLTGLKGKSLLTEGSESRDSSSHESWEPGSDIYSAKDRIAILCGLAGAFQETPEQTKVSFSDEEVSVVFSTQNTDDVDLSLRFLLTAGYGLLEAFAVAQDAQLCCETFPILCDDESNAANSASATKPIIRLSQIDAQQVRDFVESLQVSENADGENASDALSRSATHATRILRVINPIFTPAVGNSIASHIDVCSLAVQALCLALVLFSGGYMRDYQLPTLKQKFSRYELHGCLAQYVIAVRPRALSCVGDMLAHEEVMTFSLQKNEYKSSRDPVQLADLLACIEDFIELWGPASCVYLSSEDTSCGEKLFAINISDGYLTLHERPPRGDTRYAHWTQGLLDVSKLDVKAAERTFHSQEPLLIGWVHHNEECGIDKAGAADEARARSLVTDLNVREGHWTIAEQSVTMGVSQYVAVGVGFKRTRTPDDKVKQAVLDRLSSRSLGVLMEPRGLVVSMCTGVAKRVPLRVVLAMVLKPYLQLTPPLFDVTPAWKSWEDFKGYLETTLSSEDCVTTLVGLEDSSTVERVAAILLGMAQILADSGLSPNQKAFHLAWPFHYGTHAYWSMPLEYRGSSDDWSKVLEDTRACATFAVATLDCLEAPGVQCRCRTKGTPLPVPRFERLWTSLERRDPRRAQRPGSSWTLLSGKTYFVGLGGSALFRGHYHTRLHRSPSAGSQQSGGAGAGPSASAGAVAGAAAGGAAKVPVGHMSLSRIRIPPTMSEANFRVVLAAIDKPFGPHNATDVVIEKSDVWRPEENQVFIHTRG